MLLPACLLLPAYSLLLPAYYLPCLLLPAYYLLPPAYSLPCLLLPAYYLLLTTCLPGDTPPPVVLCLHVPPPSHDIGQIPAVEGDGLAGRVRGGGSGEGWQVGQARAGWEGQAWAGW